MARRRATRRRPPARRLARRPADRHLQHRLRRAPGRQHGLGDDRARRHGPLRSQARGPRLRPRVHRRSDREPANANLTRTSEPYAWPPVGNGGLTVDGKSSATRLPDLVRRELQRAFRPPFLEPTVVVVNGLLMTGAWFLLPE